MSHFERGVCRRGHFDCATESLVAHSKGNFTTTCRRAQQVAVLSVDSSYPLVIPDDLIRITSSLSFRRHEQQSRKAGAPTLNIQAYTAPVYHYIDDPQPMDNIQKTYGTKW